ncbi:MAG: hypothetical protein H7Y20_17290 [Bryobacteraceae bacterium]|nr:hypothetical protein [Bryobacteraceae bacterium]
MSCTVFLGNLPTWVTADDIKSWLSAEGLVADSIKVIRNPETQESKGFAFIEAPNAEELQSIIRRFDRAPLEDRLLRANPAQPPRGKIIVKGIGAPVAAPPAAVAPVPATANGVTAPTTTVAAQQPHAQERPARKPVNGGTRVRGPKRVSGGPQSAFAEELAKAL